MKCGDGSVISVFACLVFVPCSSVQGAATANFCLYLQDQDSAGKPALLNNPFVYDMFHLSHASIMGTLCLQRAHFIIYPRH
jgi:hypothetical protein